MADLVAENGGAAGEAGGHEGDEEDQPGNAIQACDVDEGGGFFGHLLLHLHGDVVRESFQAIFTPFSGY